MLRYPPLTALPLVLQPKGGARRERNEAPHCGWRYRMDLFIYLSLFMWHGRASWTRLILNKCVISASRSSPLLPPRHSAKPLAALSSCWQMFAPVPPAARRFDAHQCFCLTPPLYLSLPLPFPHFPRFLFEVSTCVRVVLCTRGCTWLWGSSPIHCSALH